MVKGADGTSLATPELLDGSHLAFALASEGHSVREAAQALNEHDYGTQNNRGNNPSNHERPRLFCNNEWQIDGCPSESAPPGEHE